MTNKNIPSEDLLDPQQNSTLDGLLEMVIPKSKDGKIPGVNEIGFLESLFGFYSPQLAAFFSAAGHSFAKLFSKASKNTPLLAAG